MSGQPCGCDFEAGWTCLEHQTPKQHTTDLIERGVIAGRGASVHSTAAEAEASMREPTAYDGISRGTGCGLPGTVLFICPVCRSCDVSQWTTGSENIKPTYRCHQCESTFDKDANDIVRGKLAPLSDSQLLSTMDGVVWAREFCRLTGFTDESAAQAWFCNAIMAGYDESQRRRDRSLHLRQFSVGDFVFFDFMLHQVKDVREGRVCELHDGLCSCASYDLTERCFPVTLEYKRLSDLFEFYYAQIHRDGRAGLNFPDIHRWMVDLWVHACQNIDNATIRIADSEKLAQFVRDVNDMQELQTSYGFPMMRPR